jgi:Rrf2 family protein
LGLLLKAGLAESRAGQSGGYRLLRAPADISMLEIVEAGEGPMWPRRCTIDGGPCRWEQMCPVHPAWEAAWQALSASLKGASLASILEVDRELESGRTFRPAVGHPEPTERMPPAGE